MLTESQQEHGWFYSNFGTLLLALVLFLSDFVFNDFVNKDEKLQEDFKKLNIQVAELNASIKPLISNFNMSTQNRYTMSDADRDNKRVQNQLDEVKVMVKENQTTLQSIKDRISRVEASF